MRRPTLKWDEMYAALAAFHKTHGHCNVPVNYRGNPQLGRWVAMQRYRRRVGELPDKCVELLERLGFVWSPADAVWNRMFEELLAFKKKHGHCDVPTQWSGNPHLANWVANQRHRRKMGTLPAERVRRLDAIGFVWAVYGKKGQERKDEQPPEPSAPARSGGNHEERLYLVAPGEYVQYNGAGRPPPKLERYLRQHNGEFPPYIPLPTEPVQFKLCEDINGSARCLRWPSKGRLPAEVLEFVAENGALPPHH